MNHRKWNSLYQRSRFAERGVFILTPPVGSSHEARRKRIISSNLPVIDCRGLECEESARDYCVIGSRFALEFIALPRTCQCWSRGEAQQSKSNKWVNCLFAFAHPSESLSFPLAWHHRKNHRRDGVDDDFTESRDSWQLVVRMIHSLNSFLRERADFFLFLALLVCFDSTSVPTLSSLSCDGAENILWMKKNWDKLLASWVIARESRVSAKNDLNHGMTRSIFSIQPGPSRSWENSASIVPRLARKTKGTWRWVYERVVTRGKRENQKDFRFSVENPREPLDECETAQAARALRGDKNAGRECSCGPKRAKAELFVLVFFLPSNVYPSNWYDRELCSCLLGATMWCFSGHFFLLSFSPVSCVFRHGKKAATKHHTVA